MLPPLSIVEGKALDCNLNFRLMHGEFAETFKGARNDVNPRTTHAISLGPNGNLQGEIR